MRLHLTTLGTGPDLVLLHGWGMNSTVWQELAESLAVSFRVSCVDLPGHGMSESQTTWSLDSFVEQLIKQLPQRFNLIGWSLGGLLALKLTSRYPERVEKLLMLASSPVFVEEDNWSAGQNVQVLQQFKEQLKSNKRLTTKRFMRLQTQGLEQPREAIKALETLLSMSNPPSEMGLRSGLEVLQTTDLRDELACIGSPVLFLLGEKDQLIPMAAGALSQNINKAVQVRVIKGASHVPFLSHKKQTQREIERFFFH